MIPSEDPVTDQWREALCSAVDSAADATRPVELFLEQRDHSRLDYRPGERAGAVRTHMRGLAATDLLERRRHFYRSSPGLGDVERVAALDQDDSPRTERDTRPRAGYTGRFTRQLEIHAVEAMGRVAVQATRMLPSVRLAGRAVVSGQRVLVARPRLGCCDDTRISLRIRMMAQHTRGVAHSTAVVETALHHLATGFKDEALDRLAATLVRRVERRLEAARIPAGRYSVVLAPGVGGVLVHEIVGHALEADTTGSWLTRMDGLVAPEDLSVIDDPRAGRAAWKIDDEGVESRAGALIRGGRVVGRLHDRETARRDGVTPTGHARRSSFREAVLPRMGCTFVAAGSRDPDELVREIGTGIYVRRMEAGTVDNDTSRAVFRVTDADRIVAGRLCAPLQPFVMVVNGREALAGLTRVGHDLTFDSCIGSCHREGQTLSISVGAPTICIGSVGVVG